MSLLLPDDIPVAAQSLSAIESLGPTIKLPRFSPERAIAQKVRDDPIPLIWAAPALRSYRSVWSAVHRLGLVEDLAAWGEDVDIDHVFPRSWAAASDLGLRYLRLFPVWAEVNRSAGGSREKAGARTGADPVIKDGIVYASELQVLKMLGHPVGTATDPVSIFD